MPTATPGTPATITIPSPSALPAGQRQPNLLNRLAEGLQSRHYSRRTEQAHLREVGSDIRTIQGLLGHTDLSTTMICTAVLTKGPHGVLIPVDTL